MIIILEIVLSIAHFADFYARGAMSRGLFDPFALSPKVLIIPILAVGTLVAGIFHQHVSDTRTIFFTIGAGISVVVLIWTWASWGLVRTILGSLGDGHTLSTVGILIARILTTGIVAVVATLTIETNLPIPPSAPLPTPVAQPFPIVREHRDVIFSGTSSKADTVPDTPSQT